MAEKDALVLVFSRNAFYKRLHFLALGAFFVSLLIILVLIIILGYLLSNPTKPLYFAADNAGRLIRIVPVDTPHLSKEEVLDWGKEAVEAAFSYDFINYRSQLQDAQKFFTDYGWTEYMKALTLSNNLRALTQRKQIVTAQVVEQPTILREGLLKGAYAWEISMPLLVTYSMPPYDGSNQYSNSLVVSTIIQRQPILSGYRGLGILQLIGNLAGLTQPPPQTTSPRVGT